MQKVTGEEPIDTFFWGGKIPSWVRECTCRYRYKGGRKESIEGLLYVHDKLAERYSLLNSLGEDDVILDRVSHYAEPNIKVSRYRCEGK